MACPITQGGHKKVAVYSLGLRFYKTSPFYSVDLLSCYVRTKS